MENTKKNKIKCLACGNNPTNHISAYIQNTVSIFMQPIVRLFLHIPFFEAGIDLCLTLFMFIVKIYLPLFKLLRMVSWNTDTEKAASLRSRVIWEEAQKRNIPMRQMVIMGKPVELYEATIHGKKHIFESIPRPPYMSHSGDMWMDDKYALKEKLQKETIPVPKGGSVTSYTQAVAIFNSIQKPVIVKPRLGSRGRHTTTHVYTEEELLKAFTIAQELGYFVVIEEHIKGSVYRGTVIGGKVIGILRGDPPRITGDGIHTIKELIEEKNRNKKDPIKDIEINEHLTDFIHRLGYTLESVIPDETTIDVLEKIGVSYGGSSREMFNETHPKVIEYIQHAGRIVDAPVVGFDFIISDPTQDPDMQHWGIIECNSLPFINLHHFPVEGTPVNAAGYVWDLWNK